MFIKAKEWTINTSLITYIFHYDDGGIDIYFVDGKKIYLESSEAVKLIERLHGEK
jgi:hypothetical protein